MAGLRAQATWKATVNSSKAIYLDFGTIQVLISHAAISGKSEAEIQAAADQFVGWRLILMGALFDAVVSAIDDISGYVDYYDDSGEQNVQADHIVWNLTRQESATVQAIDTGANRITVTMPGDLTGWLADDELAIAKKRMFVHKNDDGSLATAIGVTEPEVWPEDAIYEE